MQPRLITLDFETFYSKEYSLSKMTTEAYVRDPRFEVIGVSVKVDDQAATWFSGPPDQVAAWLQQFDIPSAFLLCHHTQFDGFILTERFGIRPKFYLDTMSMAKPLHGQTLGVSLKALSDHYTIGVKGDEVVLALGKRRGDFTPEELTKYGQYCCNDVQLTYILFQILKKELPIGEIRVIDLILRMFTEPKLELDPELLRQHLVDVKARKEKLLASVAEVAGADVLRSNQKFAQLLEQLNVMPPKKISRTTNRETFAFSKTDVKFKALLEHEDPRVQAVVSARLGTKSTLEETRTQAFIDIAARGTLPVYLYYYGAHCVPGDVEVLTPTGWEPLNTWTGGEIAQVDEKQKIQFLRAERFVGPATDQWVTVTAPYLKSAFTLGHTVPYLAHESHQWKTLKADELSRRASIFVPLAGRLVGSGAIAAAQMRVLAMVQADGSYEVDPGVGRRLTIFVKKERKILRARQLLIAAGVSFSEQTYRSHPGFVRFIVRAKDYPNWLRPIRKLFGPWLLDSTVDAREALLEELVHWDGYSQGGMTYYSTSERCNADWIATLCHLTNRCASIQTRPAQGERRENYVVAIRQRSFGLIKRQHVVTGSAASAQQTFCTVTITGFWLARHHGRIFVTGNTGRASGGDGINLQNLPSRGGRASRTLRRAIRAPQGHVVIVGDSAQIEARILAWLAGQEDLVNDFANASDIYSKFASSVFGYAVDRKKKLIDEHGKEFNPHEMEGQVGKTCILGLGYGMGAPKFQWTLTAGKPPVEMELKECQRIVWLYRNTYAQIPRLWDMGQQALIALMRGERYAFGRNGLLYTSGEGIHLPNGMVIRYPHLTLHNGEFAYAGNRKERVEWVRQNLSGNWDFAKLTRVYGGKVVENVVQALARIVVFDQMLHIGKQYRVVLTEHDAIALCVPEVQADEAKQRLIAAMSAPPAWAPGLPLAAEVGVGQTYGDAK